MTPASLRARSRRAPAPVIPPRSSRVGRLMALAYGAATYALFLGTFLYAIGFVSGHGVSRTVDGGVRAGLLEAVLVNGGLLALLAAQPTIRARCTLGRRWTRLVPPATERSTLVLTTCLILGTTFWQWRHLPGTLWERHGPVAWFLTGVSFLGWGLVLLSTFLIDHFELFGLRPVLRHFRRQPIPPLQLRERSPHRAVRHPLMLGFLLALWATPVMTAGHLFLATLCTGTLLIGLRGDGRTRRAEPGEVDLDGRRRSTRR